MASPQAKAYTEDDYYALSEDVRAELIHGQLYYQDTPSRMHQATLGALYTIIRSYIKAKKSSCHIYPAPFAVKLFNDRNTIVEPDISIICDPGKLTDKGCSGAPDWIIEIISPSASSCDYVLKLNLYMEAGVQEYWIVDPQNQTVLVYFFEKEAFQVKQYTFQDKVKANIYNDLYIDFTDLGVNEM